MFPSHYPSKVNTVHKLKSTISKQLIQNIKKKTSESPLTFTLQVVAATIDGEKMLSTWAYGITPTYGTAPYLRPYLRHYTQNERRILTTAVPGGRICCRPRSRLTLPTSAAEARLTRRPASRRTCRSRSVLSRCRREICSCRRSPDTGIPARSRPASGAADGISTSVGNGRSSDTC